MNRQYLKYIAFIVIAILIATFSSTAKKKREEDLRQKSRYYYFEGLRHQSLGNEETAYEYFKHAYSIDTTYSEAAYAYGSQRLALAIDTMQSITELKRSADLMKKFVEEYPDDYNEALYYAFITQYIGNSAEAIRVFDRTLQRNPELTSILLNLADIYAKNNQPEKALESIRKFEKSEGLNPALTVKKIGLCLVMKDTIAAIQEATDLIDSNPNNGQYYLLKGNLFETLGQKDSTLAYYKRAESLIPDASAPKIALANFYLQEGDSVAFDENTYNALLAEDFELDEKRALVSEYLQKIITGKNDIRRGDHLFGVLRQQYPHEPTVIDLSARYNAAKGDFKAAIEEIAYAIDLSPSEEIYRTQLISYLLADKRPQEAIKAYEDAIKFVDPSYQMKLMKASAAQMAEDFSLAINSYTEIINSIAPGLPVAKLIKPKDVSSSLTYEDLERLSQLFANIGDCEYQQNKILPAFTAYDNALLLFPDNYLALNNYAYFLCENNGDLEKAEEMSKRSLSNENGENPTYLDTYARILFKLKKLDEAKNYQAKALQLAEKENELSAELYDHYADILIELADYKEAILYLKKALNLEPENIAIKEKLKKIEKLH